MPPRLKCHPGKSATQAKVPPGQKFHPGRIGTVRASRSERRARHARNVARVFTVFLLPLNITDSQVAYAAGFCKKCAEFRQNSIKFARIGSPPPHLSGQTPRFSFKQLYSARPYTAGIPYFPRCIIRRAGNAAGRAGGGARIVQKLSDFNSF